MKKVLVIGCPGSGKSTLSRALQKRTELRLQACDTVIFLDYPTQVCLDGVRERQGKPRPDMPWIETQEDSEFIEFIERYHQESRPQVMQLLEKYADKKTVILHSREEGENFLNHLL